MGRSSSAQPPRHTLRNCKATKTSKFRKFVEATQHIRNGAIHQDRVMNLYWKSWNSSNNMQHTFYRGISDLQNDSLDTIREYQHWAHGCKRHSHGLRNPVFELISASWCFFFVFFFSNSISSIPLVRSFCVSLLCHFKLKTWNWNFTNMILLNLSLSSFF